MNTVKHWTLDEALHREDEVDEIEEELPIADKEGKGYPVVLEFYCTVAEVLFFLLFSTVLGEDCRVRPFHS